MRILLVQNNRVRGVIGIRIESCHQALVRTKEGRQRRSYKVKAKLGMSSRCHLSDLE
jgi:hypothetical protein